MGHLGKAYGSTAICSAGTVKDLSVVLDILKVESGEFAYISCLPFKTIEQAEQGHWIGSKERERILETVVHLKRRGGQE